jgi:hypothetical protein
MPTPVPPGTVNVGVSPLRRLTSDQYRNTVRDLLGVKDALTLVPVTSLPSDDSIAERFASNVVSSVAGLDADKYADAAELLARRAVMNLATLTTCDTKAAGGELGCATQFIQNFGKRAFRRPLNTVEVDRYKKVYTAGGNYQNGLRLVIQGMLQSPKFLYLVEPVPADAAGKVLQLDSWSVASRLSYFFLNSLPDDMLFAAAEANQLTTADNVGKQAIRLMADPRFKDTLGTFHDEWLELDALTGAEKDAKLFPLWNATLQGLMGEQIHRFVEGVVFGDGKVETLLAGNFSFLNGALYDIYGMPKPAGAAATTWTRVDLKPTERAGILTHAGILAGLAHENRTSFILRGKIVREAILCMDVPPPPSGVDTSEAMVDPNASARDRSAQHRRDPMCASCHALFDPIGFAFESYDPIGKYRAGVDSTADITSTRMLDGKVNNAIELAQKLAGADEVRECVAKQWMRFGLGRQEEAADASSITAAIKGMRDNGGKITELLAALARSDSFRHMKVKP